MINNIKKISPIKRLAIPLLTVAFLFGSCGGDPLDVDVSDIEVDITFERFEQELATAKSPMEMFDVNSRLIGKGGELYEFYIYDILSTVRVTDDSIGYYLYEFQNDKYISEVNADIKTQFGDFSEYEDRIVDMFKHLKYHIEDAPMPKKVVTYNSAFRYGVVSTTEYIGIGLDMYLGENNRNIQQLGFPVYMKKKMAADYLPVDVAHSWLITNVMEELNEGQTFLSSMIYWGKLLYSIDAMMPDLEDHLKIRYTLDEYEFALASEDDVWYYLIDMDWIYSTDIKVLMRFFHDAPTTVGIDGSPDRLGQFMGWRIVRQYMEKNEDVTVEELLNTDESKILKSYKPVEDE